MQREHEEGSVSGQETVRGTLEGEKTDCISPGGTHKVT